MSNSQAVYFGGSRHPQNINPALIAQVVGAVVANGQAVHVGCQYGADQAVIQSAPVPSLFIFAVGSHLAVDNPAHISQALHKGAKINFHAGNPCGESMPIKARYLLRSITAFQGCESAVFFSPGAGSLAVARECVRYGLPIHAFGNQPAPIPSCKGAWFSPSWFSGFQCWSWGSYKEPEQYSFF